MTQPLCKDCKWIDDKSNTPSAMARCQHPSLIDLVTGQQTPIGCAVVRSPGERCGPDGSLFEQRNSAFTLDTPPPEGKR
jgi:hypothetical protein